MSGINITLTNASPTFIYFFLKYLNGQKTTIFIISNTTSYQNIPRQYWCVCILFIRATFGRYRGFSKWPVIFTSQCTYLYSVRIREVLERLPPERGIVFLWLHPLAAFYNSYYSFCCGFKSFCWRQQRHVKWNEKYWIFSVHLTKILRNFWLFHSFGAELIFIKISFT